MNADPEILEFLHPVLSAEESDRFADEIEIELIEKGWGLWAVALRDRGTFLGFVGFHQAVFESAFSPCIEIGWRLKRDSWGLGYATEAGSRCLEYGFGELGFDKVYSFTSRENLRSRRVMEKIGLAYVGEFDHPNVPELDLLRPHVLYMMDRDMNKEIS